MIEKIYLGLSFGFNSSACVVSNTRGVLAAISEERLCKKKNTKEFPWLAAEKCLELAGVTEVDDIIYSYYDEVHKDYLQKYTDNKVLVGDTAEEIITNNINVKNKGGIYRIEHHSAHAYSTFGFYGVPETDDYYLITSDGFGDGYSARIIYKGQVISNVLLENSLALVYQFVTGALGFKEHQHEGKITGLAAYGKPIYLEDLENLFNVTDSDNFLSFKSDVIELTEEEQAQANSSTIISFDKFLKLKKAVYALVNNLKANGATREDISASVQEFSEKYTLKWLRAYCTTKAPAYIAGGLFANVKINQRIKDTGLFDEVFVCPAMGDEGTCVGAVINYCMKNNDYLTGLLESSANKVMSGSVVTTTNSDILQKYSEKIKELGLENTYKVSVIDNVDEVTDKIVDKLTSKQVVCVVRERMEFGPRALCHRSILYDATLKETNDALNKRLSRSEFMPFAPVCRVENAESLFKNFDGGRNSAKFMTMTFDGTDEFVNIYRATAHVDGTARPQTINAADDKVMWDILNKYELKCGLKCLVNTSFNLHEHPIIEEENVALDSFLKAALDVLVINNAVVVEKI